MLDDIFAGWGDVVAFAGLIAQWGLPAGMVLVAEQLSTPYLQLLVHASALLHVLVAFVVSVNAVTAQ